MKQPRIDHERLDALLDELNAYGKSFGAPPIERAHFRPRLSLFFRWYDLWIGAYYDTKNRVLYVCPIPMFGLKIQLGKDKATWR